MGKKASIRRLHFCNFKLDVILRISQQINKNLPIAELLESFGNVLRNELDIGKMLLFQYSNKWEVLYSYGVDLAKYYTLSIERDLVHIEEITPASSVQNKLVRDFSIIIPVFHENTPIAFVLLGDIEEEMEGISPTIKHVHFIQTITNIIIVAIENKRLFYENLRQEAIRKELELASKVQNMLIPDKAYYPDNRYLSVRGYYRPQLEVGGDYYDIFRLSTNEVGFCIADVSGKGMSAALLMSNFQASLRALFTDAHSLESLVHKLNHLVWRNTNGDRFITFFIAKYNYHTRVLNYVNAGHNPPFLLQPHDDMQQLTTGSVGLGMLESIPQLEIGHIRLQTPASMVCYTDGVAELSDASGNEIGTQTIAKTLAHWKDVHKVIPNILQNLDIYDHSGRIFDDIAMLGLNFKKS